MAARTLARRCVQSAYAPPTARAFLHLASRRPPPVLDFLAPRAPISETTPRRILRSSPKCVSRALSTSAARRGTVAVYNARRDDEGNEMHVEITPRASNRLREIMAKDSNPNLALRITVESGGCHGFQYLMSLTTLPPLSQSLASAADPDNAMPTGPPPPPPAALSPSSLPRSNDPPRARVDEDDTVFEATDGSEAKVVMDGPSLELLKGSKIDYTMELIGSQFKIVDNPLATSSCGCGTSFDIKA